MANIKQDLLSLQYSQNFEIKGTEEANIDLELSLAPASLSTVYGNVSDGVNPIKNAVVKIFDSNGLPYKHTLSDDEGNYSLTDIPVGTYSVAAVAKGYRLSDEIGINLVAGSSIQADLVCEIDSSLSLGAIAGLLLISASDGTMQPLAKGKVTLKNGDGIVIATTYSADDGEFAFYDLEDGAYTLFSVADGYLPSSNMNVVITNGAIINVSLTMVADSRTYNGTVSGIIRNKANQAVAGCFVGLYEVVKEGSMVREKLVATTKTNSRGKYLFGTVMSGNYIIKAKLEK